MDTSSTFPFAPHWTAQDLADAVPLRLFELFAFDADAAGAIPGRSANQPPRRGLRGAYRRNGELPASFRVRC